MYIFTLRLYSLVNKEEEFDNTFVRQQSFSDEHRFLLFKVFRVLKGARTWDVKPISRYHATQVYFYYQNDFSERLEVVFVLKNRFGQYLWSRKKIRKMKKKQTYQEYNFAIKGIESLPQTLNFYSLYLYNPIS